jgi:hypothetical protein
LEKGFANSGSVTLAVMRDREFVELVLQSNELRIEIERHLVHFPTALPLSAQKAKHDQHHPIPTFGRDHSTVGVK